MRDVALSPYIQAGLASWPWGQCLPLPPTLGLIFHSVCLQIVGKFFNKTPALLFALGHTDYVVGPAYGSKLPKY